MSPIILTPGIDIKIWSYNGGGAMRAWPVDDLLKVQVSKKMSREVMAGQWSLTLTSRPGRFTSTWAYKIRPMDYIEIRMGHGRGGVQERPVLRGFVDNVRESVGSDDQGNPQWNITVNGRDFGKLLVIFQIYAPPELDPEAAAWIQAGAGLDRNFGIPAGMDITAAEWVQTILTNVIGPSLAAIQSTDPAVPGFETEITVPEQFTVNTFTVQAFTGSVGNLLSFYASQPWIEFFMEEGGGGPKLVYRWSPLKDKGGAIASPYAADPGDLVIGHAEVVSYNIGLSDNEAMTYFFVWPKYFAEMEKAARTEACQIGSNPWLDKQRVQYYGFRPMDIGTTLIPTLRSEAWISQLQQRPWVLAVAEELCEWLKAVYTFNEELFNGQVSIRGRPDVQLGTYLYIPDTGFEFYIEGYDHVLTIGGSYVTNLQVTRGRRRPLPIIQEKLTPGPDDPNAPGIPTPAEPGPLPGGGMGGWTRPEMD